MARFSDRYSSSGLVAARVRARPHALDLPNEHVHAKRGRGGLEGVLLLDLGGPEDSLECLRRCIRPEQRLAHARNPRRTMPAVRQGPCLDRGNGERAPGRESVKQGPGRARFTRVDSRRVLEHYSLVHRDLRLRNQWLARNNLERRTVDTKELFEVLAAFLAVDRGACREATELRRVRLEPEAVEQASNDKGNLRSLGTPVTVKLVDDQREAIVSRIPRARTAFSRR